MRLTDFDYDLPRERIAQSPAAERDRARLLLLDLEGGPPADRRIDDLPGLLREGDLLVLNDTRVLPARLAGRKESGGQVELLLVEREGDSGSTRWSCWIDVSRKPAPGSTLRFAGGLTCRVVERRRECFIVEFETDASGLERALRESGRMPLPPYIRRDPDLSNDDDASRYQTVYARVPGAVAAPTAGLHFTDRLLDAIRSRGVESAFLTLHVGPGTFQPVRVEAIDDHRMHSERFELPEATADAVERTRRRGGRVVAVGTTVVRTLEHRAAPEGRILPGAGRSDLFIVPGYRFRVVDALITNFHLPRSTLLMLVAAFAGRRETLDAYREALARGYRFYSYGDAMFVERRR